ncbi:polysaccharide biosynthesis tyrosine autokinase [Rhodopirellula sp. JC740]|uniref:non-specific protein-tyrosine kinase n=1 Tax=Rhodopirellula halodulae TaxID=2894198 RepID=A0ABS8NIG7_9BACT|nr:polysaccharide biosynthesis tyrosine autokinase [Rhodopirellula sp. JC740]MCC9642727.1 polysaccharide biosynthesis tyrosine autokinase [Rhodopirellula sp. JC740]
MIRSNTHDDHEVDDLDIDLDLLGIVRRRYHLIALGIFVGATLATIYFVNQVPIYESKLAVLVGQRSGELASTGTGNSAESMASMQEEVLATHMELFASPKIIEVAIQEAGLNIGVGDLAGNLTVSKGGDGLAKSASVLKATYQNPDPDVAATTLQAVFDSYQSYIEDQTSSVGNEAAELIAKAQVQNEKSLREADQAYREFVASVPALISSRENGGDSLEDVHRLRLNNIEQQLDGIRESLSHARSRRVVIRDFVKDRAPESLTDVHVMSLLDSEEIARVNAFLAISANRDDQTNDELLSRAVMQESTRTEYQQLLTLSSKERLMAAEFGENHPSVRALRTELENMRRFVEETRAARPEEEKRVEAKPAEILASYYRVLQSDITELVKREEQLLELSEKESKLAKEVETTFLLGNSLKANLERAQARYDEVFQRLHEINLTNDYSGFATDLIVMPLPASVPVWPSKTKIAALGILAGGMLGLALALLAEMTDRTFHDPAEVERVVGATILAHVPRLKESSLKKKVAEGSVMSPMLVTHHLPRGTESETFRVLRTSLLFAAKSQSKKVFLITSPSPSDGKSTTIANLAISVAQTGKRVLLIDADMRRPTVAANFGVQRSPGLSDALGHSGAIDSSVADQCIQSCEQENLYLCSSGSRTSEPSELLESSQWVAFLELARERYDIVLIDTPPLLAVADPSIVADEVDGVFLTVRIEKNNRTLVERATEVLTDKGIAIDGIIVNSRDSRSNHYAYSSYDYYGKKQYGYVASYRRYYEANDDDDTGSTPRRKRSSSKRTTPATTRSLPIPEAASTNGHATNGSVVNGSSNGHPTP